MKCPHCNSHMQIYDKQTTKISEVSFYRCSICVAEYVSSSMVTAGQMEDLAPLTYGFSGSRSQNEYPRII